MLFRVVFWVSLESNQFMAAAMPPGLTHIRENGWVSRDCTGAHDLLPSKA
ncbi:hypothetical protein V7654_09660 [Bacillus sp. JJ1609]